MKRRDLIWAMCLALAGCAAKEPLAEQDPVVGTPVLFSSGSLTEVRTKTDAPLGSTSPYYYGMTNTSSVPYMPLDGRFVCTMYYHPAAGDTDASVFDTSDGGTATTAWLKVNNNLGNSVYWNKEFTNVANGDIDTYGFDKNATCFYWQNRLTHAFLALADYNKLTSNVGAATSTETQGQLKMYPHGDTEDLDINVYDLTRGTRTAMSQQPDPILALTIMKPAGATQESNRVRLYFRHQFSQIQVNLKGSDDESASDITPEQIDSVQLLGVSTEGYVYNRLNTDGTVTAPSGKNVKLDEYTDDELEANKWGTSFKMFPAAEASIGYLKTFNAIAFGQLWAIRIFWHEAGTDEASRIKHVTTYQVPQTNESGVQLRQLQSSMRYIFDLELRRGTLAVIRTEILDWMQKEDLVYGTDGTIYN